MTKINRVLSGCLCLVLLPVVTCFYGCDGASEESPPVPVARQALAASATCTPPPPGITHWWPGDGNYNDIVGGDNGTGSGGVTFAPAPGAADAGVAMTGKVGQAFRFSAPGDTVQVTGNADHNLESLSSSTYEGWFASSGGSDSGGASIIEKHHCGVAQGWFFHTTEGCFLGDHFIGGYGLGGLNLDDGAFHHFACVKDGTAYREYVDGLLVGEDTGPAAGTPVADSLQIGSINTGTCQAATHQLFGIADEMTLYNSALTTAQIQSIFAAGSAGKCKCTPGADLKVNGHKLQGHPETWVRYVAKEVVPQMVGARDARIEAAARVTWWALKEGVLGLPNPNGFSLCSEQQKNGRLKDVRLQALEICHPGRPWQVGLAALQVPNFSEGQVLSSMSAVWPLKSIAVVLTEATTIAGISATTEPGLSIIASAGTLRKSWLLRHPVLGIALQDGVVLTECIDGSAPWCYGTGWPETARFAPTREAALNSVDDLKTIFECLSP